MTDAPRPHRAARLAARLLVPVLLTAQPAIAHAASATPVAATVPPPGTADAAAAVSSLPLLPMPASVELGEGAFALSRASIGNQAAPGAGDAGIAAAEARLADLAARAHLRRLARRKHPTIVFARDASVRGDEAYRLTVTPGQVTVAASGDAGLYYGAETLWQLMASASGDRMPALVVVDAPAMAWRGFMLDSVRHFQPVDYIERQLDRMALAKLNTFHWHLTDDQGWRIQIDRYPKLTEVGAWRTDALTGKRYGGFYTKDQIRHVVAYAAARHITVVPEIEMPGHATAMIAAYPFLASIGDPPKAPSSDWGVLPNLLAPADDTFTFVENVLDEVMALFPGRYIHIGGDEAPKDQWEANRRIVARMQSLGLKDANALQGWFTAQVANYLADHGRRMVGWDEILEGQVPRGAVVMSWRGIDGAIAAARQGHDTVLAPAPVLYLDNRQSDAAGEPSGRGEIVDWKRLYAFDPLPGALDADQLGHVIGVQANLWTEHAPETEVAEVLTWPRAAEAAELGWSTAKARGDWHDFAPRLLAALDRWDRLGWRYDRVPLDPELAIDGKALSLRQPAGIGTLRYTTDGSAPEPASPAFAAPLTWTQPFTLRAQSFLGDRPVGDAVRWTVDAATLATRDASALPTCADKLDLRLAGLDAEGRPTRAYPVDIMDACWRWPAAPTDGPMRLRARVARLPYNFSLGKDLASVHFAAPRSSAGELEVHQDDCGGPLVASLSLAPAENRDGESELVGDLTPQGAGPHDLCFRFTQPSPSPLWVLDRLSLEPAR